MWLEGQTLCSRADLGSNPSSAPYRLHHPRPVTLSPPEWRPESLLCTLVGSAQHIPSLLSAAPVWYLAAPSSFEEGPIPWPPFSLAALGPGPPPPAFPIACPSSPGLRHPSTASFSRCYSNSFNSHGNPVSMVLVLSSPFYRRKILRHGRVKSLAQGHTIRRR